MLLLLLWYSCKSLKDQMDLVAEEKERQDERVRRLFFDAKEIQQLLVHINAREELCDEQLSSAAAIIRRIAKSEGAASQACLDNADVQVEAASVMLERLQRQTKSLPDIPELKGDDRLHRALFVLQECQKDIQNRIDELMQRCSLPLPYGMEKQ